MILEASWLKSIIRIQKLRKSAPKLLKFILFDTSYLTHYNFYQVIFKILQSSLTLLLEGVS